MASTQASPIVGIVGGLGPESTVDYYRAILSAFRKRAPNLGAPHIVITSIDVDHMLAMLNAGRLNDVAEYLLRELDRLYRAGATFAVISANTPHIVFDRLVARTPLPLVSIVEAVGDVAQRDGFRRLGLFGTRFTMEASFFPETLARRGIEIVRPRSGEIDRIHGWYISELLRGVVKDDTRAGIVRIAERLRDEDGVDGVILAGTELPLLFRGTEVRGLTLIDSTLVHVDAIVARLAGEAA